ncbi:HRDC-like protein [Dipodascopsis tothii]|uniref:HRDC-like protein n=1 Tax=Dipodascopsis tothii TaxID=44089 RepID=UPI0034CEDCB0
MASRPRPRRAINGMVDDVDAAVLSLGPEFEAKQVSADGIETPLIALNLSEARLLMIAAMRQRQREMNGQGGYDDMAADDMDEDELLSSNPVMHKTQEYLSIFARFKDEETVSAVEHLLKSPENAELHPFEIAQLGSLSCEEAEEAKTLVPSLAAKKTDQELQALLDNLRRYG